MAASGHLGFRKLKVLPLDPPSPKPQLVFTRDSIYAVARICYGNSVRPSVCLSVTRVDCIQTAERIIEILSLSDRPIILVFRHQGFLRKSDGFTPNGGTEYKAG